MNLYQDSNTLFHRLHPVTKLVMLILLVIIPFFLSSPLTIAAMLACAISLLLLSGGGPNIRRFAGMLCIFWIFTFLMWIAIPRLRHIPWSYATAAFLATRVDVLMVCGIWFTTVTRVEEFLYALMRAGIPYRPAFALSLGFRLVPLFYRNLQTIVAAQKSRGVDFDTHNPLEKIRNYVPVIGILISYGIRNAEMMAMSLEAKGFGHTSRPSSYLAPRFSWIDIAAAFLAAAGLVGAALI